MHSKMKQVVFLLLILDWTYLISFLPFFICIFDLHSTTMIIQSYHHIQALNLHTRTLLFLRLGSDANSAECRCNMKPLSHLRSSTGFVTHKTL